MTTITIEKAIVHRALSALEYHTQQTRPIHNTELVIEELRAALSAPATAPQELAAEYERGRKAGITEVHDAMRDTPATAPERKPMPLFEINARWEQSVLGITRLQYYQVIREVESFHGIKESP